MIELIGAFLVLTAILSMGAILLLIWWNTKDK